MQESVKPAQGGLNSWQVAADSLGINMPAGHSLRFDCAFLVKSTHCRTKATDVALSNHRFKPIIKPAQGGLNSWLGQLDSNQH